MADRSDQVREDECSATGEVRDVVYLGALTRYIVSLDTGTQTVVAVDSAVVPTYLTTVAVLDFASIMPGACAPCYAENRGLFARYS